MRRSPSWSNSILYVTTLLVSLSGVTAARQLTAQKPLVVRGQVVWLTAEGQPTNDQTLSTLSHRHFGFRTIENHFYRFSPDDSLVEMFTDPRVRARQLQISGLESRSGYLEIIGIKSLRNQQPYDIFYFCEVCNITTYSPGPCVCCQQEVELKETPISTP